MQPVPSHITQNDSKGIDARQFALMFVVVTILFPYLRVLPLSSDTQPNFLLALFFFGPLLTSVRRTEFWILVGTIMLLLCYMLANPVGHAFRSWPSYLTPPLVILFTHAYLQNEVRQKSLEKIMDRSFYLWVGFGSLQWIAGSEILRLTYRSSTTLDRGWMSFAGEPSAFGTVLFLFAAYYAARGRIGMISIAFATTLIVCQSAVGLIYFGLLGITYTAVHAQKFVLPLALFVFGAILFIDLESIVDSLPDSSRLANLVRHATVPGSLQDDGSIVSRVADLVNAYKTLTEGSFFGNGLSGQIRIKSGWGAYVFELGWIGLFLVVGWILYFISAAASNNRNALASTLAIIGMLFSSTPMSVPIVTFVIAVLIFEKPPEVRLTRPLLLPRRVKFKSPLV